MKKEQPRESAGLFFCRGTLYFEKRQKRKKSVCTDPFLVLKAKLLHAAHFNAEHVKNAGEEVEDRFESSDKIVSAGSDLLFSNTVIFRALTNAVKRAGAGADSVKNSLQTLDEIFHDE
ncbi:MAG: hypothetical protein IKH12_08855 [Clostridia bacterium]|nr:hypothetical protein [Clostridia bacterium]